MIEEEDDNAEPESVGVDKLDDVDEWKRKGLLRVEERKYEWLRRGIKGGAFGGFIVSGCGGLMMIAWGVFMIVYGGGTPDLFKWEFWEMIGAVVFIGVIFLGLPSVLCGSVAGIAVCRLIKGKGWLYGTLSLVAGLIGGIAWLFFLCTAGDSDYVR